MSESAVDLSTSEPAIQGVGQEQALREIVRRLERIQLDISQVKADVARLLGTTPAMAKPVVPVRPAGAQASEPPPQGRWGIKRDVDSDTNDELPRQCIDPLKWLGSKRITVKRVATSSDLDGAFDQLSLFLGQRFTSIQPFYAAVKRRVAGSPYPRSLNMTEYPATTRSDICIFAKKLHASGFLSQCHYHKTNRSLLFDPQPDGRVTNFFTGEWLERYALLTAVRRAESRLPESQHPSTMSRVVVELPDRLETELDVLLGLPDRVLWLECKTSDWQNHVMKFGRVARHMGIPARQAALVLLEPLSPSEKKSASALSSMTVINPQELEAFIESALTDSPLSSSQTQAAPVVITSKVSATETKSSSAGSTRSSGSDYAACLAKRGLRPLEPAMRSQVVQDLLRLMKVQSLPFHELAKVLRAEYKSNGTVISASQLSDVATAMRRAGLCQRLAHPNYPDDVFVLRPDVTVEEALYRCSQLYVWSLLKNPIWSTDRDLDATQLCQLLNGTNSNADPALWLADLCQTMAAEGRCIRKESVYVAVGDHFDGGAEQAET